MTLWRPRQLQVLHLFNQLGARPLLGQDSHEATHLFLALRSSDLATGVTAHAGTPHQFDEQDRQEVKAVFLKQAAAATAHDIAAFEQVFAPTPAGQPDPVTFIARAYQFWGKTALIEHFKETFKGVWKFEPDAERVRVIPLTPDAAEIYAPTQVTFGTSSETAQTAPFLVYEVAVRTSEGWRIAAIVPVPAQ